MFLAAFRTDTSGMKYCCIFISFHGQYIYIYIFLAELDLQLWSIQTSVGMNRVGT